MTEETATATLADSMPADMTDSTQTPEPQPKPAKTGAASDGFFWGTGRRKTSVARVRVRPGDGKFMVNKKEVDVYFTEDKDRNAIAAPLGATGLTGKVDVYVNVSGGGYTGQAGAVVMGLARAIAKYDQQHEHALRDGGYMTRDDRMVERKKPGMPGARKRFQFSKR